MRILIFILILGLSTGCNPTKSSRNSFSKTEFCYTGKILKEIPFSIQGYYKMHQLSRTTDSTTSKTPVRSIIVINVVFFSDGSFVYTFNPEQLNGLLWGTYIIESDTIKGHFIEPPRGMSWEDGYVWFKIIDQVTLKKLNFKYRAPITYQEVTEKKEEDMPIAQFINLDSTSYQEVHKKNWLKNRKWYWCNEEDFKVWQTQNTRK